jgi:hypothetical protein
MSTKGHIQCPKHGTAKVKTTAAKGRLGEKRNYKHITPVLTALTMMGVWNVRV